MNMRLVAVVVVVAVLGGVAALAWNSGRESAGREDAFRSTCLAVSANEAESEACLARMKQTYAGPLDDNTRLANAAAQAVADYREGL